METLFQTNREFTLWKYRVSHGQLLLRSVPTDVEPSRLEILFRNVFALQMTTEMEGISIRSSLDSETAQIEDSIGVEIGKIGLKVFILESVTSRGYVVASSCDSAEDDGDYKAKSSLMIGG